MKEFNKDYYQLNSDLGHSAQLSEADIDQMDIVRIDENKYHIIIDMKSFIVDILKFDQNKKTISLKIKDQELDLMIKNKFDVLVDKMGLNTSGQKQLTDLKAPMPGLVLDLFVSDGIQVKKGDQLMILEAMKMENIIKSPIDTTISKIFIEKGETVNKGQLLISFL